MTKICVTRDGLFTRKSSGAMPYFIFEITKSRYRQGGRALVEWASREPVTLLADVPPMRDLKKAIPAAGQRYTDCHSLRADRHGGAIA